MPSDDDEVQRAIEREQERARIARGWSVWLAGALRRRGIRQRDLAALSEGRITAGTISRWMNANAAPSADEVVLAARLLDEPPEEALRAAGYDPSGEDVAPVLRDGEVPRQALSPDDPSGYVGDMEPHEPERYEPTFDGLLAAIADLGARMDRRFANVLDKIDNADADIEVVTTLARTQQRELREFSSRFDRIAVRIDRRFDRVDAEFGQVRADLAALKTETALVESSVDAVAETVQRHLEDPTPHAGTG